jgi:uncharacterized protein YndB with AHSA1/START domain
MNNMEGGMIEQTLRIQARPETVWRFFTDPARPTSRPGRRGSR